MEENLKKIEQLFGEIFDEKIHEYSYIEIIDNEEIVLKANKEGLLILARELIQLCDSNFIGKHYHLDECGMANKCDKPVVITLVKPPWA